MAKPDPLDELSRNVAVVLSGLDKPARDVMKELIGAQIQAVRDERSGLRARVQHLSRGFMAALRWLDYRDTVDLIRAKTPPKVGDKADHFNTEFLLDLTDMRVGYDIARTEVPDIAKRDERRR